MFFTFLFIIGSAFFGFSIISLINVTQGLLISQILSGWCLGSMIISSIAFVTSYFFPLTFLHTIFLLIIMFAISFIIIFIQFYRTNKLFGPSTIRLERAPSFYFSLAIIGLFMLFYINSSFDNFPDLIPAYDRLIFETEHSFISSIISGINNRRKHFLTFSDPYLINQSYTISALPELYAACLVTLASSYPDVTILISFLSSLSTAAAIFLLSYYYSPESSALIVFLYFFNGGSSIYNFFNGPKNEIPHFIVENLTMSLYPSFSSSNYSSTIANTLDGVHNCGRGESPHYSIFGVHLAFSKISGFSIPLGIFALGFLHGNQQPGRRQACNSILSGLFAAFIPSLSTSFTFFIIASNYSQSFMKVMPFAISLLPKIYKSFYIIFPLWREYQMNGIFFSQFVTFSDSIGIPFIFMFLFPFFFFDYNYFHRILTIITGFLFLCFVREGNDSFANDIALSALFIPSITGNFVRTINSLKAKIVGRASFTSKEENENKNDYFDNIEEKIEGINKNLNETENEDQNNKEAEKEEDKISFNVYYQFLGVYNFFYYFLIAYIILSGVLNINTILNLKTYGLNHKSIQSGNWVGFYSNPNDIILTDAKGMNPAPIAAGRQVILGRASDLWRRGEDTQKQAELLEKNAKENNFINYMIKENINFLLEYKMNLFALSNNTYLNYFKVLSENEDWVLFQLTKQKPSNYRRMNNF
ncbi:hypothetical protein M9Y10_002693 [Tritrichomonas musculus]|uniref:ComEC/Rec2-related protein domain-containing protein n=1 Tax=Tritrichomonas musculus TaxID=1915356 RepID=A0ABR2LBK1_9EUKA